MYIYDDSKNSICKLQCSPIVIISPREVTELDFYTTCPTDQSKFYNPSPLRLLVVRLYVVENHTHVFLNIPMGNAVQMRTSQGYY